MRRHQNGITLIGWLVLLIPLAIVGYAGMRLVPAYLTYLSVSRSLQQVASQHAGESDLNAAVLRQSLTKRFDIEDIQRPSVDEILIQREDGVWTLEADYSVSVPLLGGISVSVDFDKHVQVQ